MQGSEGSADGFTAGAGVSKCYLQLEMLVLFRRFRPLASANPNFAAFKTAAELIDFYLADSIQAKVIDLSGGQPDLVPEWGYWVHRELSTRGPPG